MKLVDQLLRGARRQVARTQDRLRPEFQSFLRTRRKVRAGSSAERVVLINQYNWFRYPTLYIHSLICPSVAEALKASLATFDLTPKAHDTVKMLYRRFGAEPGLGVPHLSRFEALAEKEAARLLGTVRSKQDLLNLRFNGLLIGDLVYDMFLRYSVQATVDLAHPRIHQFTREAIAIACAGEEYFARHEVAALFPDHTLFVRSGVMTRLAFQRGVPVYLTPFTPDFFLQRLDPTLSLGMENPAKRWSYPRYREIFEALPAAERAAGRARAREWLDGTVKGVVRNLGVIGHSPYAAASAERLLAPTKTAKILILLHDFCDNVHCYRHMLFDDFYEWARHLFAKASATPWEWYVKPHPNALTASAAAKIALNDRILQELQKEFPAMRVLARKASNRQLVEEGLAAAFTVHGTAGYELAHLGIPVVNAGDNLQISFPFNLHPQSIAEFDALVADAGSLAHSIDPAEVEAFAFMQHFYVPEKMRAPLNPIDPAWRDHPNLWIRYSTELLERSQEPRALDFFVKSETEEKRSVLHRYAQAAVRHDAASLE